MVRDLIRPFVRYLGVFFRHVGRRFVWIVLLSLLMGYAEGVGIALIYPLFTTGGVDPNDPVGAALGRMFALVDVPLTPAAALPVLAGFFVLKGVLLFASVAYLARVSADLGQSVRSRMVETLQRSDYLAVTRANPGFYANLLTAEIPRLVQAFVYFCRAIVPAINVLVFLALVMLLDWKTTVVCGAMGVAALLVLRVSGRVAKQSSEVTAAHSAKLTELLIQMMQGFKYLRTTGAFTQFGQRIRRSIALLATADRRNGIAWAAVQAVSQPLMVIFLVAVLYYRAVIQGDQVASLFILLVYFFRIMGELVVVQQNWQAFVMVASSVDVVEAELTERARRQETHGTRPYRGLQQALTADLDHFAYAEGHPVLRDIRISIARHSTVAFVGESGSGKSTLVDLLTGTLPPSGGTIALDGVSLAEIDLEAFRRRVGYVPQESVVFDDSVANNISLWTEMPRDRLETAARRARCLEFVEAMPGGFDAPIGDRGTKLSGGQRQRLAIARELIKEPDLLVLDEATSALDSESERAIQESIDQLRGKMTILVIAHRLSTIRNADYIYVLHEGRIVEEGRYDELVARDGSRFQRMCQLQNLAAPA